MILLQFDAFCGFSGLAIVLSLRAKFVALHSPGRSIIELAGLKVGAVQRVVVPHRSARPVPGLIDVVTSLSAEV